jgi:hypothetical protein
VHDKQHKNNKEEFHYRSLTDGFTKYVGKKQAEVPKQLNYSNTNLEFRSSQIQNMERNICKREEKEFPHAGSSSSTKYPNQSSAGGSHMPQQPPLPLSHPPPTTTTTTHTHTHTHIVISSSTMWPPCCHILLLLDTSLHI